MQALPMIAMIATGVGTAVSAMGTIAAGREQANAAMMQARAQSEIANNQAAWLDFRAKELEVKAANEVAAAQQEALQQGRQKRLALSRLQARSAASGFTSTDANSINLASEIEQYGTLQQQLTLFGGQDRAIGLRSNASATQGEAGMKRYEANARLAEGKQAASAAKKAASINAVGTILGGISSMAGSFGGGTKTAAPTLSRYTGTGSYMTSHAARLGY